MVKLLIENAVLIDGNGSSPVRDAGVLIDGEMIEAVGRSLDAPRGAERIDAEGMTLMPGLMDLHVHMAGESLGRQMRLLEWSQSTPTALKLYHAARNARSCLEAGFTTVRCIDIEEEIVWGPSLREAIELGIIPGPRILASAGQITRSGKFPYGSSITYVGKPDPYKPAWRPADGPWECRRAVREAVANGADFIKFFATGSTGGAGVKHYWVIYTLEEIKAITDEAHRMERRCACHAHGTQGIKDAVVGGTDTIEHGTYLDDEGVALMKEHGTYYVPTFTIHYNVVNMGEELRVPPHSIEKIRDTWEHSVPSVQMAHRAGVKIACGTDSGGTWARCGENARELELLSRFGEMTVMEAIQAATKVSAEAIGREDTLGTIEPGKLADLILVDGDPLKDIKILQDKSRVKLVIKGGRIEVDRRA